MYRSESCPLCHRKYFETNGKCAYLYVKSHCHPKIRTQNFRRAISKRIVLAARKRSPSQRQLLSSFNSHAPHDDVIFNFTKKRRRLADAPEFRRIIPSSSLSCQVSKQLAIKPYFQQIVDASLSHCAALLFAPFRRFILQALD